jgi:hypothetical protein
MARVEEGMRDANKQAAWTAIFLALGLAAALILVGAEGKPNFSGEWKLNLSKSEFGPFPAPNSRTDKIDHKDPNLKINTTSSGQQGEISVDLAYTTDGKESTNTIRGNPVKSTVKWEGGALLIDSKGTFGGNDVQIKDKWTLSEDGKTLTINRHFTSQMGEADQKQMLEKQ